MKLGSINVVIVVHICMNTKRTKMNTERFLVRGALKNGRIYKMSELKSEEDYLEEWWDDDYLDCGCCPCCGCDCEYYEDY